MSQQTTRVSVEEVAQLKARLAEINSIPFDQIEWTVNGDVAPVFFLHKNEFKFVGLNNTNFPEIYDFKRQEFLKDD